MESNQWTTIANKTITEKPLDSGQRELLLEWITEFERWPKNKCLARVNCFTEEELLWSSLFRVL